MGERISPFRFVLKYVTDIAAIQGHAGIPLLSCPFFNTIRIFRVSGLAIIIRRRTLGEY
jgi:hypothetical protein